MIDEVTKNELFSYIEKVAEEFKIFSYEIKFSVVKNHFMYGGGGILVEVNVSGTSTHGKEVQMDFYVQMSDKTSSEDPVKMAFQRQIFFFTQLVPCIVRFFKMHKVNPKGHFVFPYCFKTFSNEDRYVLMFNKIQDLGYRNSFKTLTADQNTICMVLKSIATFHALTFAIQSVKPGEFFELLKKWTPVIKDVFLLSNIERKLKIGIQMALDMLVEENRDDIRFKLLKDIENGILFVIDAVLSSVPAESVIVHGDVWLHNIFILREKINPTIIKDIILIYWHLANFHSPVLDLSYFFYLSYSEDVYINYERYVEYYYKEFTEVVVRFKGDPTRFPFLTLLEHLKNYSIMPLVVALGGIPMIILKETQNVDIEEYETMEYGNLQEDVKNVIKEKLLGVLKLHYKYFGE